MKPINIAIFASGNGSNCENLIRYFQQSALADCVLVISNKPDAYALVRAERLNVPTAVISKAQLNNPDEMLPLLHKYGIKFIVLAGFLPLIPDYLVDAYPRQIINLHPALLPSFPGAHGIADAFRYGVKVFGITIHFVDEGVDTGKIINQFAFHAEPDDTLETVETKIHQLEHKYVPMVINDVLVNSEQ